MKKIINKINCRIIKSVGVLSLLLIMGALPTISIWGPNKEVIKGVGISFAFVGIVAGMKKKGLWDTADDATKKFAEAQDEAMQEAFKSYIKVDDLKGKMTELLKEAEEKGLTTEQMKSLNETVEAVKKHATKLEKMGDPGQEPQEKALTFAERVVKALNDNKANLEKAVGTRESVVMKISLKVAPGTITTATASSSPNAYLPMPMLVPGVKETPQDELNILQLVNVSPSDSPNVTWVNEKPVNGDADYTAEGALKSQVDWAYENQTATSTKITAFVKSTTQALRNITFLANRINTRLVEIIRQKLEDGLINDDGTGDKLKGIVEYAPGFTTTSFNDSVVDPQTADALVCMAGQIDELNFTPNIALLNPVDIRKMKLVKDKNGQYVMPPFATAAGTYVDGLRVVANKKIAVGYALVGDLNKYNVFIVEDMTLDIGLDGNDFTYNRRTVLAEIELGAFVSSNEVGAFCYDAISTVKAAIEAPGI